MVAVPDGLTPASWLRARVPERWRKVSFLLENYQWFGLLLLTFVGLLLDRLPFGFVLSGVHRLLRSIEPPADEEMLRSALRPVGILAMALVWWAGVHWLDLSARVLTVLLVAVKFLAATSAVWAAYRVADMLSRYFEHKAGRTPTRFDDLLVPLLRKTAKTFIIAFGLVFIADNLNVDISSLLAGLGLGGLAFALAAQDTVKNLFGSLTVLLDRPFQVGDWVVIGDNEGTVEEVGFRSTRIRTFYNSLITLPNSNLISSAVDNMGARAYRRWSTNLSLTYDTPPDKIDSFCEGVRELIRNHPNTRKDYFHVYANKFAAASIDVLLYVFFDNPDWSEELEARHRLLLDIVRLAADLEVEFAFPTQTLHLFQHDQRPQPDDGKIDS